MNARTMSLFVFLFLTLTTTVFAQPAYNIKELTPEVKAALDSRKARFEELRTFKSKSVIGENSKGYVDVLEKSDDAQALADAENNDRKFIYQAIVEQNELSADSLATIEGVFAQVQRDKAASGDKVQTEDGSWVSKP